MIQKNQEYEVEIIDNGFLGEGIAKIDGFTVFVKDAIKGEKVKIKILKVVSSHAFAKIEEIIEESKSRVKPDCEIYNMCGGCTLRHMNYFDTLMIKKEAAENTLRKELKRDIVIDEIIGMENPLYYRNKLEMPFGKGKDGKATIGFFKPRTHEIVETENCLIHNEKTFSLAKDIVKFVRDKDLSVYNEETGEGLLRHLIIRIGIHTGELMVLLVVNEEKIPHEKELIDYITDLHPEVKVIAKNINNKNTNVILGNRTISIFGPGYIEDSIGKFKFRISPRSFYQVNPIQVEKLYQRAVDLAELTGEETVFDLYCGIGTIGIFASDKVKKLYGIETVDAAIIDARENAKLNGIENAEFFTGDVEYALKDLVEKQKVKSDVIFVDPPRRGCDKEALDTIMKIAPKKIVYVSCNPATLARDIGILEENYHLGKISAVDMFPYTSHVECVAVLERK